MNAETSIVLWPNLIKALSPAIIGAVVAAVAIAAAIVVFVLSLRRFAERVDQSLARIEGSVKAKPKVDDARLSAADLRRELEPLQTAIGKIPAETAQQVASALQKSRDDANVSPPPRVVPPQKNQELGEPEDGVAQLLAIANRIVQQSSTTLDDFRASAGPLARRVAAWPSAADGAPLAFIVEYRGQHYAVPNVVKPTRLPKEWFNRSEFGFNDEIQRVVSLPRLRRVGDRYDVQEAGVFGR